MPSLVDVDDMPAFLRGGYTDDDVTAALSWASAAVEAYCQRSFGFVADDVVTVRPFSDRSALLPNPPVTDVSLVEGWMPSPATDPQAATMEWVTLPNYQFTELGVIYDTTGLPGVADMYPSWPALPSSLRVTYDHGFTVIPDAVVSAVVKAAGTWLDNPSNLMTKRVDDVQYTWMRPTKYEEEPFGGLLTGYRLVSIA